MIATDFAQNEQFDDAWLSFRLMFQPWRWKAGKSNDKVKHLLRKKFFPKDSFIHLFLTGRGALYYLIQSLNLPKGSEIVVQAFTCEAVILPILENKCTPIYVDIEPKTYSMNPDLLEKKLTPNTRIIILQQTFGIPPHREKILALAKKYSITVIEDLAHGFNPSMFKVDTHPTLKLLSFGRSKSFSSVFGGAIVTADQSLSEKLLKIEKNLIAVPPLKILQLLAYKPLSVFIRSLYGIYIGKILHKIINIMCLLAPEISTREKNGSFDHTTALAYPNALAILMVHQLNKFEEMTNRRLHAVEHYSHQLQPLFKEYLTHQDPLIRFPLMVDNRQKVLKEAKKKNIYLGSWYTQPVDPKVVSLRRMKYTKGSCPIAESIGEKIINLPTNVTQQEAEKVTKLLIKLQEKTDK